VAAVESVWPLPGGSSPKVLLCVFAGDMKESFRQLIPLQGSGIPEEVAKAALFLASDDSSFVIGEEIKVSGGEGNLRI